jgi:hypothetical protein
MISEEVEVEVSGLGPNLDLLSQRQGSSVAKRQQSCVTVRQSKRTSAYIISGSVLPISHTVNHSYFKMWYDWLAIRQVLTPKHLLS